MHMEIKVVLWKKITNVSSIRDVIGKKKKKCNWLALK